MKYVKYLALLAVLGCQTQEITDSPQALGPRLAVQLSEDERSQKEAISRQFMVATQGAGASQAAIEIMKSGGNIADAFVAASFAISVERPQSTGIGGGGFLLFYNAKTKKTLALDFREVAPAKAHKDMFLDAQGNPDHKRAEEGIFSVAVPGLVDGLFHFHKQFGKLPWKKCLEPAINLAEKGFPVHQDLLKALTVKKDLLQRYPSSKKIFYKSDGSLFELGDTLVQKDLARTLKIIAQKGRNGFYKGAVAAGIINTMDSLGGIIQQSDLDQYKAKTRTPIRGEYKDLEIVTMPPPSSGGVHILQILSMLEKDQLHYLGPRTIHLMAASMQQVFADRAKFLGDADFAKVPISGLIDKPYNLNLRKQFGERARPSDQVHHGKPEAEESEQTTHLSFMDIQGNVISSTQTINGYFGSGIVAEGTGILLNNEMDDFAIKVGANNLFGAIGGDKNLIEAFKKPLSSMSPTIVFRNERPILTLGSPGGTRILTCVAQTLLNYLEFRMPLYESVASIRFHHQWKPDEIKVDPPGFDPQVTDDLESLGYKTKVETLNCRVQAVSREADYLHGVADPRDVGLAYGF